MKEKINFKYQKAWMLYKEANKQMNNTDYGNALIFIDKAISFYTEAIHKPLLSIAPGY